MELVVVIHHPGHPTPPRNEFVGELTDAYDGTLESQRQEYVHTTNRIFGILLNWSSSDLGRPVWHQHAGRKLVKAGMALLYEPAGRSSDMHAIDTLKDTLVHVNP